MNLQINVCPSVNWLTLIIISRLFCGTNVKVIWNCQEMCSRRIPKITDRQESGGVMRELL